MGQSILETYISNRLLPLFSEIFQYWKCVFFIKWGDIKAPPDLYEGYTQNPLKKTNPTGCTLDLSSLHASFNVPPSQQSGAWWHVLPGSTSLLVAGKHNV